MWDFHQLQKFRGRIAALGVVALLAGAGLAFALQKDPTLTALPPVDTKPIDVPIQPPQPQLPAPPETQTAPKPPPVSNEAHIVFTTLPPTNATVVWGKKTLGKITPKAPLVITRPRDSGPLDVMVYAPGYLPVQTRAHTFSDTKIQVKLTTPDQKQTLFGYRAPLDAGVPADQAILAPNPADGTAQPAPPILP